MKIKESDITSFDVKENKQILEKIDELLDEIINKLSYKNKMLYLTTKNSMIAFGFSGTLMLTSKTVKEEGYCLSMITIFDKSSNIITQISKEKGYKCLWEQIEKKTAGKYIDGLIKHKIPVDDVLKLLEG